MKPTTDDLVVLTAALAGVVLGTAAMGWAAWMLLRRGFGR